MESKAEIDHKPKSLPQVIYRAVGWVAGTYQPSDEDVHQGIFSTEDGLSVPAQMTWQLRGRLKHRNPDYTTQPDFFTQSFQWTVYPKTDPLQFELTGMKQLSPDLPNGQGIDEFCVVGEVKLIAPDVVDVRIQSNQGSRRGGKKASFNLTLTGSLPETALGQVWELKVRRIGEKLTVVDGQPYEPSAADLVWLEQQQRQAAIQSNLPAPILKQQPKAQSQLDTTIAAPQSHAVTPELEVKYAPDVSLLASKNADIQTIRGKIEVVASKFFSANVTNTDTAASSAAETRIPYSTITSC